MSKYYTRAVGEGGIPVKYDLMDYATEAVETDFFYFHMHWGLKGVEKSNNIMAFTHDLIKRLKPSWDESKIFEWVLRLMVFDVPSYDATVDEILQSELAHVQEGGFQKIPILLWDDIGMYFGKRMPLTADKELFLREFDAVREDVAVLAGTSPKPDKPHKGLRDEYTHEIYWRERGFGWVEYYNQSISKKPGESKVRKELIHYIKAKRVPLEVFIKYRYMKRDAKQRLREARLLNFTPRDIQKLIDDRLYKRDREVLFLCFDACGRKGQATTNEVHKIFQDVFGMKEKYVGYLHGIYKYLHGLGVVVYRVRGKHGEVSMTPKGIRAVEMLNDIMQNPLENQTTQTGGTGEGG